MLNPADQSTFLDKFLGTDFAQSAITTHLSLAIEPSAFPVIGQFFLWGPLVAVMRLAADPTRFPLRTQRKHDMLGTRDGIRDLVTFEIIGTQQQTEGADNTELSDVIEPILDTLIELAEPYWVESERGSEKAIQELIPVQRDIVHLHNFGLSCLLLRSEMGVEFPSAERVNALVSQIFDCTHYTGWAALLFGLMDFLAKQTTLPFYGTQKKPPKPARFSRIFREFSSHCYPLLVSSIASSLPHIVLVSSLWACLSSIIEDFAASFGIKGLKTLEELADTMARLNDDMGDTIKSISHRLEREERKPGRTKRMSDLSVEAQGAVDDHLRGFVASDRVQSLVTKARSDAIYRDMSLMVIRMRSPAVDMRALSEAISRNSFLLRFILNIIDEKVLAEGSDAAAAVGKHNPIDYTPFLNRTPVTPSDLPASGPYTFEDLIVLVDDYVKHGGRDAVVGAYASADLMAGCMMLGPAYTIMRLSMLSAVEKDEMGYAKYATKVDDGTAYGNLLLSEFVMASGRDMGKVKTVRDVAELLWRDLSEDTFRLLNGSAQDNATLAIDIIRNHQCLRAFGQAANTIWAMMTGQAAMDVEMVAERMRIMFRCINARSLLVLPVAVFEVMFSWTTVLDELMSRELRPSPTPLYHVDESHLDALIAGTAKSIPLSMTLGCIGKFIGATAINKTERYDESDMVLVRVMGTRLAQMDVMRKVRDLMVHLVELDMDVIGSGRKHDSAYQTLLDNEREFVNATMAEERKVKLMRQIADGAEQLRDFDKLDLFVLHVFGRILRQQVEFAHDQQAAITPPA